MLSGTTLFCIATVAIGCYVFLYLAGKQQEVENKDRYIRRWQRQQEEEERAKRASIPKVAGGPPGSQAMPGGQPQQSAN